MRGLWIAIWLFFLFGAVFFGFVLAGPCLSSAPPPSPPPTDAPSGTPTVGATEP